jgi:3-oxoacyl-[acyl-carrier-protein] synthase III
MKTYIHSLSSYVPSKRVSNEELVKNLDTTDEWIVSHTGIKFRHIADESEASSDLGIEAAKRVLEKSGLQPDDIDLIITGSASPDYPGFPSTACVIQDKIGAHNAGAMDLLAACTSFIYGIETAKNFIATGSVKTVLVIGTETMSTIVDWTDRDSVLFGDGAGAAIVRENTENEQSDIIDSYLRAEGAGAKHLLRKTGGSRSTFHIETAKEDMYLKMNGRQVYTFAVRALCDTIKILLDRNNLKIDDVQYIVPHQANTRIIEAAAKRLEYPMEKFFINIQEYGNTSAASIPLALDDMQKQDLLRRGDVLVTVGFGGGLTYGGNLLRW